MRTTVRESGRECDQALRAQQDREGALFHRVAPLAERGVEGRRAGERGCLVP
ncbi:hypothetical protein OHA27_08805 [Streptomyces sp. NBC_01619]|uniref:Uncharacterized protein n=1 Tax=Streptomyces pratisoli TaxID=3139917 RepID=A0ACC6QC44_9ACTN|nr:MULTISPECIES: hypothetical protein [unclassified Streptomyces]MCX4510400.1 hypothetical protein [Streptomyces sp. NBC_01619]